MSSLVRILVTSLASCNAALGSSAAECTEQLVVGGEQVLRVDASFADHGHEVGIASPARQNVQVEMIGNARTCDFAKIHPQVVPVRMVSLGERRFEIAGQVHHLG